jgi:hypothetical protein
MHFLCISLFAGKKSCNLDTYRLAEDITATIESVPIFNPLTTNPPLSIHVSED